MKIAMLTRSTPSHSAGGMERVSWDLACQWVRTGHAVTVFTTPLSESGDHVSRPGEPHLVTLDGKSGRYSRVWFRATSTLDLAEYDVVIGVSSGARAVVRKKVRPPVVLQAHGTPAMGIPAKLASRSPRSLLSIVKNVFSILTETRTYRLYDAAVVIGPTVEESLRRIPGILLPRRVELITNGVSVRTRPTRFGDRPYVAVVGRIVEQKGIDRVMRACSAARVGLVVVGEGPARPALEDLARSMWAGGDIVFTGELPEAGVRDVIARARCVAVPSRGREGLPTVVLESLAEQRKVLVSGEVWRSLEQLGLPGVTVCRQFEEWVQAIQSNAEAPVAAGMLPDRYRLDVSAAAYVELFNDLTAAT